LRLRNANAVDIGNEIIAYDADLALFADFSRDRPKHRVPPRGAECSAYDGGGQGDELVSHNVPLGTQRLLKQSAVFEVSDQPVCRWKRQRKSLCDLRGRDGFALVGNMPNDRESPIQRSFLPNSLRHFPPGQNWK
jgi:hypothetical protein